MADLTPEERAGLRRNGYSWQTVPNRCNHGSWDYCPAPTHHNAPLYTLDADRLAGLVRERDEAVELLRELVDDDECSYDHHLYCQTHHRYGWCAQERARAFLASVSSEGSG